MRKKLRFICMACLFFAVSACEGEEESRNENDKKNNNTEEVSMESKETKDSVAAKEEETKKGTSQPSLYQDRLTSDNMGSKKILYENLKMNDTQRIDNVNITLEGIQFTEITPSDETKPKFEHISNTRIVALTMKLKLENNSEQPLNLKSIGSFLRANDNQLTYMSQTSLEPDQQRKEIAAGASGEKLLVFFIDKDLYSLTKKLKLEFGPFRDSEGKELFKGKKTEFVIPVPE
jgi:hypothetical protein